MEPLKFDVLNVPLDLNTFKPTEHLARAETLPAEWYTDSRMLELEKERIFYKTWQPVGRVDQVRRVGDYFVCEVVGQPLVITRGLDEKLRGFYNVCMHRAGPVALGQGNRKSLQCRYHGWTYDLEGKLIRAPEFEGVENWSKEDVCLSPIMVEEWGPWVFVNLDPDASPMSDIYGPIQAEILSKGFDLSKMSLIERRDYVIDCNWKVYVDNYLEGYHLPIAHPGLFKELDYDQYRVDTYRYYSSQYAPIRPVDGEVRDRRYVRTDAEAEALYYWVFPNVMLNVYMDNTSINIILPLGHDKTLTIFEWYFQQPGTGEGWESMQQIIAFSDQIQQEDIEICENVQKGLKSNAYNQGRFSVLRENGVHHFQSLVHEFLTK
ncbi:MAG: Rieske 2Fe-2S domain-containing protein [Anaerolineaceae bacterium]|nr:Rieske 2Fe-2S domain-containing protein [Anaerolineaceae bacterium]